MIPKRLKSPNMFPQFIVIRQMDEWEKIIKFNNI
jgi:hypothetical protein